MKTDYAGLLDDAANCIGDMSRADLQILLRRAALVLRNAGSIELNDQVEEAIDSIADELGKTRNDMIRYIIQEWLEKNAYLPVRELVEDGEVDGNA
ncbi:MULTISPECIES: ribbon-helix-helix domain-containing protein [Rhizobium]|uniref:ribbon-helix-helix domain-containing protein n=1 Tax=Rhizobium TaxID=379 RepID=UPI00195683F0|nr:MULTISPECIES: ribbon-helix-helix domain-containing protein [Rhizobium]MBM7050168.1 ribbon-helix-helix protein, CopG family [Rhizobium lusitanum]